MLFRSTVLCLTVALLAGACTSEGQPVPDAAPSPAAAGPVFAQSEPAALKRQVGDIGIAELSSRDAFAVGWRSDAVGDSRAAAWRFVDGRWRPEDLPAPDGVREHGADGLIERADGSLVLRGWATDTGGLSFPAVWWGEPGAWQVRVFPGLAGERNVGIREGIEFADRIFLAGSIWLADDREPVLYEFTLEDGLVRVPTPVDGAEGALAAAATDGDQLVVLAYEGPSDTKEPAALLHGRDPANLTSTPVALPDALRIDEVAASGDGAWVLAGRNPGAASGSIAFWRGAPLTGWTPGGGAQVTGSSSIGEVRLIADRLYASGTLLMRSDDGGRTWLSLGRVFGAGGWVRSTAAIDGVEMVAGSASGSPGVILSGDDWSPSPATDDAWASEPGTVLERSATNLTAGAGVLLAASTRTELIEAGKAQPLLGFLVRDSGADSWEPVDEAVRGSVTTAVYTEATGFVAGGYLSTDDSRWAGGLLLQSPDGRTWSRRGAVGLVAAEHRIQAMVPVTDGVLALGMTWANSTPGVIAFHSVNGTNWAPHEVVGLEGYGLVDACGAGDEVRAVVFAGGVDRALARSHDGGVTWEVVEEPAFEAATTMTCQIGGGDVVVGVGQPGEEPTLWIEEETGYRVLDLAPGPDTWFGDFEHDASSGLWFASGQYGEAVGTPFVAVSRDLDTWVVHDIAADVPEGESAWANSVAVDGEHLVLIGGAGYLRYVWEVPLASLAAGLPPPADAA